MKGRVLLAEDDLYVRAFMDEALHFLGYEVVTEPDGAAALARVAAGRFDIVITDHTMPGLDGLELVRALRARAFAGRVFVVSGAMPAGAREEYGRLRVDGIAEKPLEVAALHRLLRRVVAAGAPVGRG